MSEQEPTKSGLTGLGTRIYQMRMSCGTEHVDIWRVKESSRVTTVKVICENDECGGSSPTIKKSSGEFYIGGTEIKSVLLA